MGSIATASSTLAKHRVRVVPAAELKPRTWHVCPGCNHKIPSGFCLPTGGPPVVLDTRQAAAQLGITRAALMELFRCKRIRAFKVGKLWKTTQDALNEFIATGGTAPEEAR